MNKSKLNISSHISTGFPLFPPELINTISNFLQAKQLQEEFLESDTYPGLEERTLSTRRIKPVQSATQFKYYVKEEHRYLIAGLSEKYRTATARENAYMLFALDELEYLQWPLDQVNKTDLFRSMSGVFPSVGTDRTTLSKNINQYLDKRNYGKLELNIKKAKDEVLALKASL